LIDPILLRKVALLGKELEILVASGNLAKLTRGLVRFHGRPISDLLGPRLDELGGLELQVVVRWRGPGGRELRLLLCPVEEVGALVSRRRLRRS
jgi:hypothetical protein